MESKRNTTVRIVPVALLHVFHLPSPQYGLPGSFTTHPSLSVSFFGSFLLFYHMYFTYHLSPQYGLPGSFATHPSLSVSLLGSFLLFYYMYFTYHPPSVGSLGLSPPTPPFLCHSSDRSCCSPTCISLTISPVWTPRVVCHPPLPFSVTIRIFSVVLLHVFHLPSPQYGLPGSFATHPSLSVSTPLEGDDERKGRLVSSSSSVSRIMSI